jgi:hypothetical protein
MHAMKGFFDRLPGNLLFFGAFAAAIGLLPACTHAPGARITHTQPSCAQIDWFEIGRHDGALGLPMERSGVYADRCRVTPQPFDEELYSNGRNAGLMEYCTTGMGLEKGRAGLAYEDVCPEPLEQGFLAGYQLGQRIRDLEAENADLQARIENLRRNLPQSQKTSPIRSQIEQLRLRRAQNDSEIDTLEERANGSRSL